MPNVEGVSCTAEASGTGLIYTVELTAFPALPYQNNIFSHNGNPGLSHFSCDISHVSDFDSSSAVLILICNFNYTD